MMRLAYRIAKCVTSATVVVLVVALPAQAASSSASPSPRFARTVVVVPVSGVVYVTPAGKRSSTRLRRSRALASGSLVDVSGPNAAAELITADPRGRAQTADLSGGVVRIAQPRRAGGVSNLTVVGGVSACGAGQVARRRRPQRVNAPSHHRRYASDARAGTVGRFRLIGRNESAINSGPANWQDTENCHGTTVGDNGGTVTASLKGNASSSTLKAGQTWLSRCSNTSQGGSSVPFCVGVLGSRDSSGYVTYTTGLFIPTGASSYDLCTILSGGPQSCQTWSFTTPGLGGFREGIVSCPVAQAGAYALSWRLNGADLGITLPYSTNVASSTVSPCDGLDGTPYGSGSHFLVLPSGVKAVNQYTVPTPVWLDWMSIDMVGHGSGQETLTGVVYQDAGGQPGRLVATTLPCVVRGTDTSDCDVMIFHPQVNVPAGAYWLGVLSSGKSKVISVQESHTGTLLWNDNPLSTASDPFGSAQSLQIRMSLQLNYTVVP
jgi:hypothetical protein